jgi:class 3 adenylate cyclase
MVVFGLAWFFVNLMDENVNIILPFVEIFVVVLCVPYYLLSRAGRHDAARIYGMFLFFTAGLFTYTYSGKDIVDHYWILVGIACCFLIFPRDKKRWIIMTILYGFVCYIAILVLYKYAAPTSGMDQSALDLKNQVTFYTIFGLFIVLMMLGRYFADKTEDALVKEREKVADMAELLKKMFGRYLSTEVMNSLIENPAALELGGERRSVTIMMTDLRGFTALSERLEPEQVVRMLNSYFEVMVDLVLKYNGTINEIIGDALLIIFGAPQEMPDRTQRAIACAIEMQNAMSEVNEQNRALGLPELEMGIGLNETEVVVGNIGSSKRSKYAVVGSGVNMTSRIESYTVGGQILISESVRQEAGDALRIDAQRDIRPKGSETPIRIYEVGGIAGQYNVTLEQKDLALVSLVLNIPVQYTVLADKDIGKKNLDGSMIRLSEMCADILLDEPIDMLTNLKMNLIDVDEQLSSKDLYGKVIERSKENNQIHLVRFTSVPPEVDAHFQSHRRHASIRENI